MAINFIEGKADEATYQLGDASVNELLFPEALQPGQHGYVDYTAIWVHPDTLIPYVDGRTEVMTLADAYQDFDTHDLARLFNFMGQLAVDVTHVVEYETKEAKEQLGDVCFPITFTFNTIARVELDDVMAYSLPIAGVIDDQFTLEFFNEHLKTRYGKEAVLGPVGLPVGDE